jgi:hypothetical protein
MWNCPTKNCLGGGGGIEIAPRSTWDIQEGIAFGSM